MYGFILLIMCIKVLLDLLNTLYIIDN
jgi:hypothetical protein